MLAQVSEKVYNQEQPPAENRPDTKAQIAYFEKLSFSFFALKPNEKKPAGGWDMFQHRQPSATEKANWIYEQRQNFAIVTGSISGNLLVVDLDPAKMDTDPDQWIQRWPTGYLVKTAANGYHMGFIAPAGVQVSNTTAKLAPGIDTRGEGGYVVAPGGRVAYYGKDAQKKGVISGYIGEYVMMGDGQPAPMPADLLALLTTEEPRQERAPQDYTPANADEAQTLAMLAVLPDWFDDYDSWRNICFAVFHGHGINGVSMIEQRWQCKPGEVLKMWESVEAHQEKRKANGQKIITYGTLVHAAKFYGYIPPRPEGNLPTDDELARLQDATAAWDALPSVGQGLLETDKSDTMSGFPNFGKPGDVPEKIPLHTSSGEAADWLYAVALAQTFAPKYTGAIIYTLARMGYGQTCGLYAARTPRPLTEIEECAGRYGLDLTYKVLYKYIGNEWAGDFFRLFSIEKDIPPMEKSGNNSGRPAEIFIELKPVDELISILERRRDDAIGLIAAEFDGKALPMRPQANYLERIEGITGDNAQAALEAWRIATDRAREGTPEFAEDYRLFTGRAGELQRVFALLRERADDLAAFEISSKRKGSDSAHNVLAAELYDYYFALLGEDKEHPIWLDCALVGVSAPTLRNKVKPLAGLRYKGDTHEYITITPDTPENVARQIAAAGKTLRGRPLAIRSDSSEWRPCKTENYAGVIDCAVKDGGLLTLRVSVSRPLERYTPVPAEITQAKAAQRSDTVLDRPQSVEKPERKPRLRKRDRNIVRESIMRLPLAAGWQYDKDLAAWRDPGRLLWPDDPVTILQALSDRMIPGALDPLGKAPVSEDTTMLTMHYQAEKYDDPEGTLPLLKSFQNPPPAPVSTFVDNLAALTVPNIFTARRERERYFGRQYA